MNIFHRCPLPYAPNPYPRSSYIADVNGAVWAAGGGTAEGVVSFMQYDWRPGADAVPDPIDYPVTLDAEITGVTYSPLLLLRVLSRLRRSLPGNKLIASVAPMGTKPDGSPNHDRETQLAENFTTMLEAAHAYAPYCDGFKLGVYMLGPASWDRDLEYARRLPEAFAKAFPHKTIWPEVCAKFEGSRNADGTTDWGFNGGLMSPEQLGDYAKAVSVAASACVVFDMSWLAGVFAWV